MKNNFPGDKKDILEISKNNKEQKDNWRYQGNFFLLIIPVLIYVISGGIFIWVLSFNEGFLILHYNVFLGIDWLANPMEEGQRLKIWSPFFVSGGIFLFNLILMFGLYRQSGRIHHKKGKKNLRKEKKLFLISGLPIRMILWAGLIIQISFLVYIISLVLVNK